MLMFPVKQMAVLYTIAKMVAYRGFTVEEACKMYDEKPEHLDLFRKIIKNEPGYAQFFPELEDAISRNGLSEKSLKEAAESVEEEVSKWNYYDHKKAEVDKWRKERGIDGDKSDVDYILIGKQRENYRRRKDKVSSEDELAEYKSDAMRAAMDLLYDCEDPEILTRIQSAKSKSEISRIMASARKERE